MRLWRPGESLAGVVNSADKPDPISLGRLRLPRLVLSRYVRFTNRFTEQAINLQLPSPLRALPWPPSLGAALCPDSPSDCQTARPRHATRRPRSFPTPGRAAPSRHHRCRVCTGHRPRRCLVQTLPEPGCCRSRRQTGSVQGRRADHALTPKAPWTGSGWREYSYGGFGGSHPPFHPYTFCRQPNFFKLDYQLGNLCCTGCHVT
jgi:hypothetical protein